MSEIRENLLIAVSDTGPLISIFQSDSLELVVVLFGQIHISEACKEELVNHGWGDSFAQAGATINSHKLTEAEAAQAGALARRIAAHTSSKNSQNRTIIVERPR
jgi:predicted nucleic acid-binding protein